MARRNGRSTITAIDDEEASGFFPVAHSDDSSGDAYRTAGAGGGCWGAPAGRSGGTVEGAAAMSEASCRTIAMGNDDGEEGSHTPWSQQTERRRVRENSPGERRRGGLGPTSAGAVYGMDVDSVGAEDDDDDMSFAASVRSSGSSKLWDRLESNRMRMEATDRKLCCLMGGGPTKNKQHQRELRLRRYARAMVGVLALAALSLSAAYFVVGEDLEAVFQVHAGDLFRRLFGQDKEEDDRAGHRDPGHDNIRGDARSVRIKERRAGDRDGGGVPAPLLRSEDDEEVAVRAPLGIKTKKSREERREARREREDRLKARREREERAAARALRLEVRERRERERAARNATPSGHGQGLPPERNPRARRGESEGRNDP